MVRASIIFDHLSCSNCFIGSERAPNFRVESKERAAKVHGRQSSPPLRATEQGIDNEEVYEEGNDDLPMQYRRLTAGLETGSLDLNRRLSNHLSNHEVLLIRRLLSLMARNKIIESFNSLTNPPYPPHLLIQSADPSVK